MLLITPMHFFILEETNGRTKMRHPKTAAGSNAPGFTLIELMIVVAIVGILSAIAIPNFVKFQCRSKQTEARSALTALYVAEESYRAEFSKYVVGGEADMHVIGFAYKSGSKRRYTLSVTGSDTAFEASANGQGNMAGDLWTINQNKALQWVSATPSCD